MTIDLVIQQILSTPPWSALPKAALFELKAATCLRPISKYQVIFHQIEQGRSLFFVAKGLVKLSKSAQEGKDTVVFLAQTGDIIGEQVLGPTCSYTCRAQALTACLLAEVDTDWIRFATQLYPDFCWALCRVFIERLREAEERMMLNYSTSTRKRIGLFLKEVAQNHGQTFLNGEVELLLPLTHQLIAEMLSVSRQQVTTIFNEWAEQGVIRYTRRRILLSKPEQL